MTAIVESIGVNYENENEISIWQTAESNLFTKSNRVSLGHFGARRMIGNPWKIQVYDLSMKFGPQWVLLKSENENQIKVQEFGRR
jgi:hypothetical protein